jgi:phage gp36-like protein
MAVYTTLTQLVRRLDAAVLAGLADDRNTPPDLADSETLAVVTQAIADGASLIDSYLLGRVDLANPATEAMLERMNATLALYFLYRRRYFDDQSNPLTASKELILEHLHAISRGEARLDAGGSETPELIVMSTTEETARALSTATLGRY